MERITASLLNILDNWRMIKIEEEISSLPLTCVYLIIASLLKDNCLSTSVYTYLYTHGSIKPYTNIKETAIGPRMMGLILVKANCTKCHPKSWIRAKQGIRFVHTTWSGKKFAGTTLITAATPMDLIWKNAFPGIVRKLLIGSTVPLLCGRQLTTFEPIFVMSPQLARFTPQCVPTPTFTTHLVNVISD
jgi:hypothetical protein